MTAMPETCPPHIREALQGPVASLRTPFHANGEIDFEALRGQVDRVIQAKAKSMILTWGDSLYSLLTDEEIAQVTKTVAEQARGRALVVAADNVWWTGKTVAFAKFCTQVGADLLMVLPPDWGGSCTIESLRTHYAAVAKEIPVMVVTNFLLRRPPDFGIKLIETLVERAPGVVALKDDMLGPFIRKVCLMAHDHWALFAGGHKQNHMNMHPYGVDGFLSLHITFAPDIAWRYWKAIQENDIDAARAVIRDYDMPMFDYIMKSQGGFDAAVHGMLEIFGIAKRHRRPPYHSLTDGEMDQLKSFLLGQGYTI